MLGKAGADRNTVHALGCDQRAVLDDDTAAVIALEHEMLVLDAAARVEGQLHPQRGAVDAGVDDVDVQAVFDLVHLHVKHHVGAVELFAVGVVHLPPIAGGGLFGKGQVIPAGHGLVQGIAAVLGGQRCGDKVAVLTEARADAHGQREVAVLEEQKARAVVQDRVGPASAAAAHNARPFIIFVVVRRGCAALVLQRGQLWQQHQVDEAVKAAQGVALHHLHNGVGGVQQFGLAAGIAHVEVLEVIFPRVNFLAHVPAGGVVGKNAVVGVDVGQHHFQVAQHRRIVALVAGGHGQHDHGIVVDAVVIAGRAFGVLAVLVAVVALFQDGLGGGAAFGLIKQPGAEHQHRRDGPAVVRGVEAAVAQGIGCIADDGLILRLQLCGSGLGFGRGGQCAVHDLTQVDIGGQQPLGAESRIRAGEEVAVDEVKVAAGPLGAAHKSQRQRQAAAQLGVQIIAALGVQVAGRHCRGAVDGRFRLGQAVRLGETAAEGAVLVQNLDIEIALHAAFAVVQDPFIVFAHRSALLICLCPAGPHR